LTSPSLVGKWSSIQLIPSLPPVRHESVHQLDKSLVVPPLQEMGQFMDDDVLNATRVFRNELKVEPESTPLGITRPPLGFHLPNVPIRNLYANDTLPFRDERFKAIPQLGPLPGMQKSQPSVWSGPGSHY
jgi:hypothetical protein